MKKIKIGQTVSIDKTIIGQYYKVISNINDSHINSGSINIGDILYSVKNKKFILCSIDYKHPYYMLYSTIVKRVRKPNIIINTYIKT